MFHKCAYDISYEQVGDGVNYAFRHSGSTLYIYFQGSSQTTDWLRNFLFRKRPYKDMAIPYRVHRGFLMAWKEVEDIIINKITERVAVIPENPEAISETYTLENDYEYKWKKVIVIGYSHGGALAAFCHECVWFHRPDLREHGLIGYGFEAPRIFGAFKVPEALQERWNNFFVIRTGSDIVPCCPPTIFGYTHVGDVINISCDPSIVTDKLPKCIKCHYPQAVYKALVDFENGKQ